MAKVRSQLNNPIGSLTAVGERTIVTVLSRMAGGRSAGSGVVSMSR